MRRRLRLENMTRSYITAGNGMEDVWFAFKKMYCLGYLDWETWKSFVNRCEYYHYDEKKKACVDNQGRIVM